MKRTYWILCARLARWWYLITEGMWRGERIYTWTSKSSSQWFRRVQKIATCSGSLAKDNIEETRVFFGGPFSRGESPVDWTGLKFRRISNSNS